MRQKVSFYTLGCKLNFAETSSLASLFEANGFERTVAMDDSDIIVINTCSVTALAEKKGRNLLSRARRLNPAARIVAIGCYAQLRPEELQKLNKADIILGNHEKFHIIDYLNNGSKTTIHRHPYKDIKNFETAWSTSDRTRTFLKIQDGCNYFCAYCTIPMARGLSRSPDIATVLQSVDQILKSGSHEVILTGVNIGDFGRNHHENFEQLLQAIVQNKQLERLRMGSIEPNLLTDGIIDMAAQYPVIMPHFHIPLQCGTNDLLQKMNRHYSTELFAERIERIKQKIPDACIAADVIVGVPGETDRHHREALNYIRQLGVSALHVFTYSERPGTKAAKMSGNIDKNIRQQRSAEMHQLGAELKTNFINRHINEKRPVLFEKEIKNSFIYGFTDNYIRVKTPYQKGMENKIFRVKLLNPDREGTVEGQLLSK